MSSILSPCKPARPQTQSSVGTREVDTLYMIWATAAIVVPTGLTGGNAFSHSQAVRNYLRDKIITPSVRYMVLTFVLLRYLLWWDNVLFLWSVKCHVIHYLNNHKCNLVQFNQIPLLLNEINKQPGGIHWPSTAHCSPEMVKSQGSHTHQL